MATAVSAVAGWTGTVKNAFPSAYLIRSGATEAKAQTVTLEVWDDWDGEYRVEYLEGLITLGEHAYTNWFGAARGMGLVDYVAGFSTIPADVEQAVLEAVQMAYNAGQTDLTLESERLGDYSYKRASGQDFVALDVSRTAVAKLHKYARVRP
jgi:hypothetical protein